MRDKVPDKARDKQLSGKLSGGLSGRLSGGLSAHVAEIYAANPPSRENTSLRVAVSERFPSGFLVASESFWRVPNLSEDLSGGPGFWALKAVRRVVRGFVRLDPECESRCLCKTASVNIYIYVCIYIYIVAFVISTTQSRKISLSERRQQNAATCHFTAHAKHGLKSVLPLRVDAY